MLRPDPYKPGVYFSSTDRPTVRHCRIHDNIACGIHLNGALSEGGDGVISGVLIEQNLIYNNGEKGGAAINMDGVEHAVVQQNRLYHNHAGGITAFHIDGARSGPDIVIRENIIDFDRGAGRYGIQVYNGSTGVAVFRNAVTCGRGPALEVDTASIPSLTSDQNLFKTTNRSEPIRLNDASWLTLETWQNQSKQDLHSLSE